ncbi:uncharacterized protein LOC141858436 isoform X2 [Brevipalpus obovatus]|uniref:uncharacterized protein LOC141853589 isoform X2 n=1 Tax=Brevipalpus obovatus TaxID=246614 RepID=UPI003D9EF8CB
MHKFMVYFVFLFHFSLSNPVSQEVISQQQETHDNVLPALELPASSHLLWSPIHSEFNCQDREYGYFADMANDCRVFHVCQPGYGPGGSVARYSFICPAEMRFDQIRLTCMPLVDSMDCGESMKFYGGTENRFKSSTN